MMLEAAITGLGVVTTAGVGLRPLLAALRSSGGEPVAREYLADGEFPYAPLPPLPGHDAAIDISCLDLLDACMRELVRSSGLTPAELRDRRTGVVLGATAGRYPRWRRDLAPMRLADAVTHRDFDESSTTIEFARRWQLRGATHTVCAACSSSASAVAVAQRLLYTQQCDRVIVGGAELLSWFDVYGFRTAQLLSRTAARPYDAERDGLMLGEGGGLVLLERPGTRPAYARLIGAGLNTETHDIAQPEPSGAALARCIARALTSAGLKARDIGYVNAHGTATVANDASEARCLAHYWPSGCNTRISSTKGLTGHLRAAGGVVELIVVAAALGSGIAPHTRGCRRLDPKFTFNCQLEAPAFEALEHGVSITRGFGGANVALVLGRGDAHRWYDLGELS
jgi:3-oxoacyl-[acyl-carrier-protein] synthase I